MNLRRSAPPAGRPTSGTPAGPGSRPPANAPAASPTARKPLGSQQAALDELDRDVRQLRIEFEKFFNGAVPIPPEDLRNRIQQRLKGLRNVALKSAVDNFRLGDLEARFNSYNELFNRRVREREEGRIQAAASAAPARARFDPERGIVFADRVETEAAEVLYSALAKDGGAPKFDLESFRTYLERQTSALRGKTGCSAVQFRLAQEDGKLKLKARPVDG